MPASMSMVALSGGCAGHGAIQRIARAAVVRTRCMSAIVAQSDCPKPPCARVMPFANRRAAGYGILKVKFGRHVRTLGSDEATADQCGCRRSRQGTVACRATNPVRDRGGLERPVGDLLPGSAFR